MNTRQNTIKRNATPAKYFDGKDLAMAEAIYNSDTKKIEMLIKSKGYDVNTRGNVQEPYEISPSKYTFLGYAVKIGEVKSAEKLLELGADPNLINDEGSLWPNMNLAANHKNKEMISLLIRYKEDLNPPLSDSPINDLLKGDVDKKLIELLLDNGADVNHPDYISGGTPLKTAFNVFKFDMVNYLLDKGADPLQLDYHGNSLASLVQEQLDEGRLGAEILNATWLLKERLAKEYGIEFPVKNDFARGRAAGIARYEKLSQADKDFLGPKEMERVESKRKGLAGYLEKHKEEGKE